MMTCAQQIDSLDHLRDYVNETLCYHEQLEIGAFHFNQRILVRGGRPCGIYFCLYGPRSAKFTAIWETEGNTILFYNSSGERFLRTQLVAAPSLQLAAA